jgi:hypothetical protein
MAKFDNQKNWKSFNDRSLRAGEVLVPQLVDEDYARSLGANMANLRTWEKAGFQYLVMFVPVPESMEKQAWSVFNSEVNDLLNERLGPNRFSRCMIPQPDGSVKRCPKKSGDNHESCSCCPLRGRLEKEDRGMVYWSQLDETEFAAGAESHADDTYKEEFLLAELISELERLNPKLARIVTLSYAGYEKNEIFKMIGVKKSQGYDLFKEAERLAKEFLFG